MVNFNPGIREILNEIFYLGTCRNWTLSNIIAGLARKQRPKQNKTKQNNSNNKKQLKKKLNSVESKICEILFVEAKKVLLNVMSRGKENLIEIHFQHTNLSQ